MDQQHTPEQVEQVDGQESLGQMTDSYSSLPYHATASLPPGLEFSGSTVGDEFIPTCRNKKCENPFIDEPPPYEMASNTNTQVDRPILNAMQSQPARAQGQRTVQAAEDDAVPGQLPTRPVEESRLRHVYNCNSTILSINLPPYISFDLTVVLLFFLVIFVFGIYWVAWKLGLGFSRPSETPTKK
jgi:hypothetical protein